MAAPGNGSRRYEVHISKLMAAAIWRIHRRASRQNRGQSASEALEKIVKRLEINPFDVGEPMYRLPNLRMQVRMVIVRPLVVDFGISEDGPLVFIKGVKLLSTKSK